jgi:hypothetical protein
MTKDELDAVVYAIGNESLVSGAFSFLAWFLPMAAACVPIAHTRGEILNGYKPSTPREVAMSTVLFSIGVLVLIFQKYQKFVEHRSERRETPHS